jgi:hypothetical protein
MVDHLVQLPVVVPPFFVEACGYRGSARYVALRWNEDAGELWLTDDGHAVRAMAGPMALLWRCDQGDAALERLRTAHSRAGRPPWLLVDRDSRSLYLGSAFDVWRLISGEKIIRTG